jgi:Glycosyltransferase family 28 N-terminal domain
LTATLYVSQLVAIPSVTMLSYSSTVNLQRHLTLQCATIRSVKVTCAEHSRSHVRCVKKLLFVCGGTGGHVFPAIAVAEKILEVHGNRDKVDIQFLGATERDCGVVRRRGFKWTRGHAVKMSRPYLSPDNIINIIRFLAAIISSILFMLKVQPHSVLGRFTPSEVSCTAL